MLEPEFSPDLTDLSMLKIEPLYIRGNRTLYCSVIETNIDEYNIKL
jgi:hypothetical protein